MVFLGWFESEKGIDPVLKAAVAHLWFVTIHPFEDGNGRIARAIADMARRRRGSSISARHEIGRAGFIGKAGSPVAARREMDYY